MNFDIKDVKSWANRHDVKVGDTGMFADSINEFKDDRCHIGKIANITGINALCFRIDSDISHASYSFFLPLDAVKEDKPKEKIYRPFKTMYELTSVVYKTEAPDFCNLMGVSNTLEVRCKNNGRYETVLITHLEYDDNHNVIAINGQTPKALFEKYELMNIEYEYVPFGVEIKE